ncbi:MAG: hypothetical protein G01um101425_790 [Candidatus Peregrinibacteria bacterium Gr01-1014_25]|nr:MAG: hypothetical protein G01um101425_790 [Candidatus Peregrinibacteria bacterium Gr01-1014_25]
MQRIALLLGLLALAGCAGGARTSASLEQKLANPLFAEYYFDDLVEQLVQLDIQNDPVLDDARKKSIVEGARRDGLQRAKDATKKQQEGSMGNFVPAKGFAQGEALAVDGRLYFSPAFLTVPSPALHVFVTNVVDPRDVEFPDDSARDLGLIVSPYAEQDYVLPESEKPIHTVVLFDTALDRVIGFAQLSSNQ